MKEKLEQLHHRLPITSGPTDGARERRGRNIRSSWTAGAGRKLLVRVAQGHPHDQRAGSYFRGELNSICSHITHWRGNTNTLRRAEKRLSSDLDRL